MRRLWLIPLRSCALLAMVGAPVASATLINGSGSDGQQNITPPPNLTYWNNLGTFVDGSRSGGSGVYLGDGWVLTANHVTRSLPFVIPKLNNGQDATFYWQGTSTDLHIAPGGLPSDLTLFRLQDDPLLHTLPAVHIGTTPQVGTNVTITGSGWNRAPELHYWHLASPSMSTKTTWTDVTGQPNQNTAQRRGYVYDPTGFAKRWGSNTTVALDGDSPTYVYEGPDWAGVLRSTLLFGTRFDDLANEGQVLSGDSGGGVFAGNRLIGINLYKGDESKEESNPNDVGQPANTAVFGNVSYFADLRNYVDEIAGLTKLHPSIDGDANLDGTVDNADFQILYGNLHKGTGWTQGDFNLDGQVSFSDFQLLERNFGKTDGVSGSVALPAPVFVDVPEPGGLMMAGVAALAGLARRRRRR